MIKTRKELRVLLLQIRDEPRVRSEEHQSFAFHSGLEESQINILNVFDTPDFSFDIIQEYDALFVGGASEASVLERSQYPFLPQCEKLLLHCIDNAIPVFASCFGFQMAVLALGGKVIRDQDNFEMGCIPVSLTADAATDLLFRDVNDKFLAVSVHQEKALEAPAGCTALAYTDLCCHAFKVVDKPFWAFQFHPEVDKRILIERLTIFKKKYTQNDTHLNSVILNAKETPQSNMLLKSFVDRVLLDCTGSAEPQSIFEPNQ